MTRRYFFSGEINTESVNTLLEDLNEFVNSVEGIDDDHLYYMYLDSVGGEYPSAQVMSDAINTINNTTNVNVILIGVNNIHSSAFDFYLKHNGVKLVKEGTFAALHLLSIPSDSRDMDSRLKGMNYSKFATKELDKLNVLIIEEYKKVGVSDAKIDEMLANGETYLSYEELKAITDKMMFGEKQA